MTSVDFFLLKVTRGPAIGIKALDDASVEKSTGGKDNSSPPQALKELDKENDKKKFTEEKDDGPPPTIVERVRRREC